MKTQDITYKDLELLARMPIGQWVRSGAFSVHTSKMPRLFRLGLVERRPGGYARWEYKRNR